MSPLCLCPLSLSFCVLRHPADHSSPCSSLSLLSGDFFADRSTKRPTRPLVETVPKQTTVQIEAEVAKKEADEWKERVVEETVQMRERADGKKVKVAHQKEEEEVKCLTFKVRLGCPWASTTI
jgi:hypothetical protein